MAVWAVRVVRRLVLIGLGVMGTIGLAATIWPAVAGVVTDVLVVVLAATAAGGMGIGVRRIRVEPVRRRKAVALAAAVLAVDEQATEETASAESVASTRWGKPA